MTVQQVPKAGRHYWLRRFNKYVLNRIMLLFAGGRVYAVVHHIGRKSGKPYKTPVVAVPIEGGFAMPLPYGSDTDWCLNVQAAGRCTIVSGKKGYDVVQPEIVGAEGALSAFPSWAQWMLKQSNVDEYLKVHHDAEDS